MLQSSPMYSYIPVKNLQRAREFYEQKLGFAHGREIAGGGAKTAWFKDSEGNILAIVESL